MDLIAKSQSHALWRTERGGLALTVGAAGQLVTVVFALDPQLASLLRRAADALEQDAKQNTTKGDS